MPVVTISVQNIGDPAVLNPATRPKAQRPLAE